MRKYLLAAAAIALFAAGMDNTIAQSSKDNRSRWENRWIEVNNKSNLDALRIHIIPSGEDCCWSRNLLEQNSIKKDKKLLVNFDDGSRACTFDIHIDSSDSVGRWNWTFEKRNVCDDHASLDLGPSRARWLLKTKMKNESQLVAFAVYAIPSGRDCCWSDDLLGWKVINPKREENIEIDVGRAGCQCADAGHRCPFDIRVRGELELTEWNFYKIDICRTRGLTLRGDGKNRVVTVRNESMHTAYVIRAKPAGVTASSWSRDLLGNDVIPPKGSFDIGVDDGSGSCTFDIDATGSGRSKNWNFKAIEVCSGKGIVTLD